MFLNHNPLIVLQAIFSYSKAIWSVDCGVAIVFGPDEAFFWNQIGLQSGILVFQIKINMCLLLEVTIP